MTSKSETGEVSVYDRQKAVELLTLVLKKLEERITPKRFKMRESDSVFLQYVRSLNQTVLALNQLVKDEELAHLDERLAELEKRLES